MQARDLMVTDVTTVSPDDDVSDVFRKFARHSFSGFPVVDEDDRVVGVVTESDLVDLVRNADRPISEVMTAEPATIAPDAGIDEILALLSGDDPDINRVPVVDEDGVLVGLVARQDVIRAFRDERA